MSSDMEKFIGPRVPADELKTHRARYLTPTLLFAAAAILLIISMFLPYWSLTLNAPQYPAGTVRSPPMSTTWKAMWARSTG